MKKPPEVKESHEFDDIIQLYAKGSEKIETYINQELGSQGVLSKVKEVILGPRSNHRPRPPFIWIIKEQTEPADPIVYSKEFIKNTFNIWCIAYDSKSLKKSFLKSEELAVRVKIAIDKGFKNDKDKFFEFLKFIGISTAEVEIIEGSRRLHQAVVTYEGIFKGEVKPGSPHVSGIKDIRGDVRKWGKKKKKKKI